MNVASQKGGTCVPFSLYPGPTCLLLFSNPMCFFRHRPSPGTTWPRGMGFMGLLPSSCVPCLLVTPTPNTHFFQGMMSTLYQKRWYLPWKTRFSQTYPGKSGYLEQGVGLLACLVFACLLASLSHLALLPPGGRNGTCGSHQFVQEWLRTALVQFWARWSEVGPIAKAPHKDRQPERPLLQRHSFGAFCLAVRTLTF